MDEVVVTLRPVAEEDLATFRRFAVEPGLVGLDWAGFRDPQAPARRYAVDGYLGAEDGPSWSRCSRRMAPPGS